MSTARIAKIAVVYRGRVLLLRRFEQGSLPGEWEPPGGGVEEGESYESGARRELEEETGIPGNETVEILRTGGPTLRGGSTPSTRW